MLVLKTIRIIFTFYKSFLLASLLITAACLMLFWEYGINIFAVLFWLKLGTMATIYWFINSYKSKEYYYYRNLGFSKTILWAATLIFDFALFLFVIIQVYKLR